MMSGNSKNAAHYDIRSIPYILQIIGNLYWVLRWVLDTMIILLSRQHKERRLYFDLLVLWSLTTTHAQALHLTLSLPSIITSLAKEVMFLVPLVSLSVCFFVYGQHYSKSYERIGMKFYGRVLSSTRKNWFLNFGGDLGIVRWVNEQKKL